MKLPKKVIVEKEDIDDELDIEEQLNDYLSDTYGYCMFGYNYEIVDDKIIVTDIDWDTSN